MEPHEVLRLYQETDGKEAFMKEAFEITGADENEAGFWWELIDVAIKSK